MDEQKPRVQIIPMNFVGSGRVLNGMFKQTNLIEAVIMAAPGLFIALKLINWPNMTWRIYGILGFAGLPFLFGVTGINDEDVFTYIYNFFTFRKNKRTALYNPRAKAETNPDYIYGGEAELPRDKLDRLLAKLQNNRDAREGDLSSMVYDSGKIFFEEDAQNAGEYGIEELPDELKTKKQLKEEKKARKLAEKKTAKEEKARLKELEKLQKKQAKQEAKNRKGR